LALLIAVVILAIVVILLLVYCWILKLSLEVLKRCFKEHLERRFEEKRH